MADVGIKINAQDNTKTAFDSVSRGLGTIKTGAAGVAGALAGIGVGVSLGAFATMTKQIMDGLDAMNDLKDATGASIENISALEDVALRTGASFDTVSTALIKLNQGLNSAKAGSDTEAAIKAIGLSVKDLKQLDPAEAFRQIAVGLSGFADDANKARIVQEIFGKSLKEVAPLLKDLAEKGQLNATVTTAQAEEAEKLNKEWSAMEKNVLDLSRTITGPLITAFNEFMKKQREAREAGKFGIFSSFKDLADAEQRRTSKNYEGSWYTGNGGRGSVNPDFVKPTLGDMPDQAAIKAAAAAAAKAQSELNRELAAQAKLIAEVNGLTGTFAEDWDRLATIYAKGGLNLQQLTDAQAKLLAGQPGVRAMHEAEIAAAKENTKEVDALFDAQEKQRLANEDQIRTSRTMLDQIEFETKLLGLNADQRALATLERELETKGIVKGTQAYDAYIEKLKDATAANSVKKAQLDIEKEIADERKRGWEETDRLARDVFTTWATDGGNAAQKIGDTLKKALLSAIYEATLKPLVFQMYSSITGGATGAAGSSLAASAGGSYVGAAGAAGAGAALGSVGFGTAASATMGNMFVAGGTAANFGNAVTLAQGGSYMGALGAVAPYLLGAAAIYSIIKGPGFVSAADSGRAGIAYDANGVGSTPYNLTGNADQIGIATKATNMLESTYMATAKALGIKSIGGAFEVGYNTGAGGANPNTVIGAAFGGKSFGSGEVSSSDSAAVQLAASRAVFTALQSSEMPDYLKNVFNSITAETASQADIDSTLAYAGSLKTLRESLTETRTPLELLRSNIDEGFATLGTSAETFKEDFVAAIDAGASPEVIGKWNSLRSALDQLPSAIDNVAAAARAAANDMLAAIQNWGSSADVRNFKASQLQQTLKDGGLNVDMGTILGATKETVLGYYNSLPADSPIRALLYKNQQEIYDLVKPVETPSQASSSGGGGGGGGSPAPDSALSAWQDATDAIVETMADLRSALVGDGPNSFVKLQAQFAIETAKAKAGDLAAAQDLPALAKSLADANKAQSTSSVQQAIFTARIVETLGSVAGLGNLGRSISVPAFAAGGLHAGGWAMVGENGPELVNMPSARVYNAKDTRAMLGGQDNAALVAAIEKLQAELAAIRASSATTASASAKTAKHIDAAANGGQPLAMTAV